MAKYAHVNTLQGEKSSCPFCCGGWTFFADYCSWTRRKEDSCTSHCRMAKPNKSKYSSRTMRVARQDALSRNIQTNCWSRTEESNFKEIYAAVVSGGGRSRVYCYVFIKESKLSEIAKQERPSVLFVQEIQQRIESKAPLSSAVLWTTNVRKSKRDDEFWLPSVCMSAAVLLKNRSPCMNAMQLINTIILYRSGITVSNFWGLRLMHKDP